MVIYFSRSGRTKLLAEAVANAKGETLFALEPMKKESMFKGAAKSFFRRATALREMPDISDTIYLCAPVWAGTVPPVVRGFIQNASWSGKTVTLLLTCGGPAAEYERSLAVQMEKLDVKVASCRAFRGGVFTLEDIEKL